MTRHFNGGQSFAKIITQSSLSGTAACVCLPFPSIGSSVHVWIIGTCPLNYSRVRYEASVSLGETTAQSLVSAIHCQASEPQPTPRDSSTHDERATRTAGSTLFVVHHTSGSSPLFISHSLP